MNPLDAAGLADEHVVRAAPANSHGYTGHSVDHVDGIAATSGVDGDPSDPDGGVLGCIVVKGDPDPALESGINAYMVINIGFLFVDEDEQAARKYPGSRIDNGQSDEVNPSLGVSVRTRDGIATVAAGGDHGGGGRPVTPVNHGGVITEG